MSEILANYVDSSFIESLTELAPAVGVGVLLGVIIAVIGWLWGYVIRIARIDV